MTRIIIIDDEPLARAVIREYLAAESKYCVIGECADGFEGLKMIQLMKPDLIFLDIQMPRLTGFEMLELLTTMPAVIFTTAYDKFALKAFDLHASDYLLKPFSNERFDQALLKSQALPPATYTAGSSLLDAMSASPGQRDRVIVKIDSRILIVPVSTIDYFESDDDNVSVHTARDAYLKNRTLAYFENLMDPAQFVRVHRSYLLKIQEITRIEPYHKDSYLAVLRSGAKIPVSKNGYKRLKDLLGI